MSTLKEQIIERLEIKNEVGLSHLLTNCMVVHKMLNNMVLDNPVTEFKIPKFLQGIKPILNEVSKKEFMLNVVEIIKIVFDSFDYELSDEEIFILYSLRDLGRFKIKDSKLLSDLEKEYSQYPAYKVEKAEFKQILRELKNVGLIDLRRGAIMLSERVMLG